MTDEKDRLGKVKRLRLRRLDLEEIQSSLDKRIPIGIIRSDILKIRKREREWFRANYSLDLRFERNFKRILDQFVEIEREGWRIYQGATNPREAKIGLSIVLDSTKLEMALMGFLGISITDFESHERSRRILKEIDDLKELAGRESNH